MKQRAFSSLVDDRLTRFVGPSHHFNRGGRIVRHEMHDLADRDLNKQLVQFYEDGGTFDPDFEHLEVGEGRKATDAKRRDLFREKFGGRRKRKEGAAVVREIRRPDPCDPSVAIEGLGHGSWFRQDLWIHFSQNPTDGRANRAEVLAALQETEGRTLGILDARGPTRHLRDPPGNGRIDARDAHLDLPGGQRPGPNEAVGIVQEIVWEFTAVNLHPMLRNQKDDVWNTAADFESLPTEDSGTKHRNYLAKGNQIPPEEGAPPGRPAPSLVPSGPPSSYCGAQRPGTPSGYPTHSREGLHEVTKRPAEIPPRDRGVPVLPLGRTPRGPRGGSRPAHRGGDPRRLALRRREFRRDERAGLARICDHGHAIRRVRNRRGPRRVRYRGRLERRYRPLQPEGGSPPNRPRLRGTALEEPRELAGGDETLGPRLRRILETSADDGPSLGSPEGFSRDRRWSSGARTVWNAGTFRRGRSGNRLSDIRGPFASVHGSPSRARPRWMRKVLSSPRGTRMARPSTSSAKSRTP